MYEFQGYGKSTLTFNYTLKSRIVARNISKQLKMSEKTVMPEFDALLFSIYSVNVQPEEIMGRNEIKYNYENIA